MGTKLTVIVDNKSCGDLAGEWGLSILVEHKGKTILADAGASDLFLTNMAKQDFDVADVDFATLSHAHYDHANGLAHFLKKNQKAKCYLRAVNKSLCYKKVLFFHKYIGVPKELLDENSDRIVMVEGDYNLCEGAYLIPHKTPGLENIGKREKMQLKTPEGWKYDDFSHEQSLVLDTDKGLVIINCCSHGGAVNIINEVSKTFPDKKVHALIGGFHLFNKSEAEIREVSRKIQETGIEFVCTGHCTGGRAYNIMKEELGDMLTQLSVGLEMEF